MGIKKIERYLVYTLLLFVVATMTACEGLSDNDSPNVPNNPEPNQPDTSPNSFSFSNRTNVAPEVVVESDPVTISGIDTPTPVSIAGGDYSIEDADYVDSEGTITSGQEVRVRVQSSAESGGSVSATLTVGDSSGVFTVTTVELSRRIEAERQSLTGGASVVTDDSASRGEAVLVGATDYGFSVSDAMEAQTLIVAYRSASVETLSVAVNDTNAGQFHLGASGGVYATAALSVPVSAGDTITVVNPTVETTATETYIDYIEFADTPFRSVSTVADTHHTTSDGTSVGPDGNVYVSGGSDSGNVLRVTPAGDVSVFASGFESAHGSDFDSSGNLYVAEYWGNSVRKITPEGTVTTFASALDGPAGVWVDQDDHVLVGLFGADFSANGSAVLRITPEGTVTTLASGGGLKDVIGIVGDGEGRLFASNWESGAVYEITDGAVTLLAETGATSNQICYNDGYIYVPSPGGALIRRISLDGEVEAFAGTSQRQSVNGALADADFARPNSCDFSEDGTVLYVMDRDTGDLRRIDAGTP